MRQAENVCRAFAVALNSASWQDAFADRCTPRVPQRAGCGPRWRFQPPFTKLTTGDSARFRLALKRLCSWRGLMGWPMYPIRQTASWLSWV